MEAAEQRRIVEALILASPEPITLARLCQIVPELEPASAKDLINELNTQYGEQDRSFEIWEVAGGFQIRTRAEFSGYLQQLRRERALRLTKAALETLAIVAYKQPATRAEIEAVRGVDSGAVLKSLLDRQLVRIAGHKEVAGRPMLYGTTRRFLEIFGLESLKQLPNLRELEELAREQGVVLPGGAAGEEEPGAAEGTEAAAGAEAAEGVALEPAEGVALEELDSAGASARSDAGGDSDDGDEADLRDDADELSREADPDADEFGIDDESVGPGLDDDFSDDRRAAPEDD